MCAGSWLYSNLLWLPFSQYGRVLSSRQVIYVLLCFATKQKPPKKNQIPVRRWFVIVVLSIHHHHFRIASKQTKTNIVSVLYTQKKPIPPPPPPPSMKENLLLVHNIKSVKKKAKNNIRMQTMSLTLNSDLISCRQCESNRSLALARIRYKKYAKI